VAALIPTVTSQNAGKVRCNKNTFSCSKFYHTRTCHWGTKSVL